MDVLDAVLVVIVLLAAWHGMRVGAAAQIVSFLGFLLGLTAGAALVLAVDPHVHGAVAKSVVALVCLMVPATLLGGVGRRLGSSAWSALRRARLGVADAGAGAVLGAASALIVAWLFASILINSSLPAVSSAIENSKVIEGVEKVMPPVPNAFANVERYLSQSGFPEVLINVLPESVGPVTIADARQVTTAVASAGASTVRIIAIGCGDEQEGSGFAVADGLIVTNAHVIAGTNTITVTAASGRSSPATAVSFDPDLDLALLRLAHPLSLPSLPVDAGYVERGTPAVVLGYPEDGPFNAQRAGLFSRFAAEGRNIYDTGLTDRVVYELEANVRPGNSGGPLLAPSGQVIGVVFSRSASQSDVGYALASPAVLAEVNAARAAVAPVATGSCID